MPHTLLLRLPTPGQEDTEWLSIDDTGVAEATRQRGPLSLAAAVARTAKVIVLAPATQILLAEPDLPPGSGAKLARAVPFALEEQLTEDIDDLVFALGKRPASGGTPVAVVSREVLQGWMSELTASASTPSPFMPTCRCCRRIPAKPSYGSRTTGFPCGAPASCPSAVELTPVTEAMIVAGVIPDPLAGEIPTEPLENAILYATREDWTTVQDEIEGLVEQFASIKIQLLPDGPLPWLARSLVNTDAVNLLQGEFARTKDYSASMRRWRTAAMLAGGLLFVHLAAEAVQLQHAKHESAALDSQIADEYSKAMPAVPMQDARRQMQTQLDRIRHSGPGAQQFLHTLQALGTATAGTPNTTIDALSFHEGILDLKVTAPGLAAVSQISQGLGKQGMTAEIQSSTPVGNGIEAHMQLRPAGAKGGHP
jgi:general secretion pathway protein L